MLSRFDESEIFEEDVILTTRRSYQREILVRQLFRSRALNTANYAFEENMYFQKYVTMLRTAKNNQQAMLSNSLEQLQHTPMLQASNKDGEEASQHNVTSSLNQNEMQPLGLGYSVDNTKDENILSDGEDDGYFKFDVKQKTKNSITE